MKFVQAFYTHPVQEIVLYFPAIGLFVLRPKNRTSNINRAVFALTYLEITGTIWKSSVINKLLGIKRGGVDERSYTVIPRLTSDPDNEFFG